MFRLSLLAAALALPVLAQQNPVEQFRADLQFVQNELPRRHPGFFVNLNEADFTAAARTLEGGIASLTAPQFYTRLQELIALSRDGHTSLNLNTTTNGFGQLALEFKWFADGVFVTAASANYPQLLRAQLVKVGGVSIDEVLARLTRTVSRENEHWPRYAVPRLLRNPGVLRGIGVASATGPVPYAFKLAGGETAEVPVADPLGALVPAIGARDGYIPPQLVSPELYYRSQYDPASRLVYIRYSVCNDQTGSPYAAFAERTLGLIAQNAVDTLVYDVRGNTGGNSATSLPLLFGLALSIARLRENPRFQVFVLSDQGTFSSGLSEVDRLRLPAITPEIATQLPPGYNAIAAVHVGEPTGGKPASFGEVIPFTLPASRMIGQHSAKFFDRSPSLPDADAIYPDITFPIASTDFFARHDPHLAATLSRW